MKIGVGIVTYERYDMFKKCINSILKFRDKIDYLCVVDDCSQEQRDLYDSYFKELAMCGVKVFISDENRGVGHSKNKVLEYCFFKGCDYVFTIEDDMIILDGDVFKKYIECSKNNNIHYLNYAHHGPANNGGPLFTDGDLEVYPHCVGSFSLHSKKLYKEVGYYDENYFNAWEHVDYYYMASLKNLTTRFWYFADLAKSYNYIIEQPGSIDESSIRPRSDWKTNFEKGERFFLQKHKIALADIPR